MVGEIQAAGLTPAELQAELLKRYVLNWFRKKSP